MTTCKRRLGLLVCCLLLLSGCQPAKPIQLGFVAELSGRNAVLGVQARNGAQQAVDEINARGGVAGRQLTLVVRDDLGKSEELLRVDRELIDSQVIALTGHTTSWETTTAIDLLQSQNMVLFSPTTSTPTLAGKRDLFFRLIPSNLAQSRPLADYFYQELHLRRAAVIFEADNAAFSETYADGFIQHFTAQGGQISIRTSYSASGKPDFAQIVSDLRRAGPADALLIVASSVETALLAQQVRMQAWPVQIASSNWAYTNELLHNGGRAIEGMLMTPQFNSDCQEPAYQDFQRSFMKKYGQEPAFAAVFSYETIQVLARALEATGGVRQGLEDAIVASGQFQGLCDQIVMDEFGDVQRSLYLVTVRDGAFEVVKKIEPGQ